MSVNGSQMERRENDTKDSPDNKKGSARSSTNQSGISYHWRKLSSRVQRCCCVSRQKSITSSAHADVCDGDDKMAAYGTMYDVATCSLVCMDSLES